MFQSASTSQPNRPRLVGDDIIIGKSIILARRVAFNGCWEVEKPQPIALSRLLSMAYGKRISINDDMLKQFVSAFGALPRSLREVEQILSSLPAPLAETEDQVAEANRLLKDGVSPYKLDTLMRGQKYGLRPAPDWAETLTLCDKGLVLGKGTVILPLTDDGLELEGRETQVLALLSIARRGLAPAEMLEKLGTVCRAVARGETSVAAIALSQLRQPPLVDWALGKSLSLAAVRMRRGMTPLEVLRKAGFRQAALEKTYGHTEIWLKFNPCHLPAGCPGGGQFCSTNAGNDPTYGGRLPEPKLPSAPSPFTSWDAYRSHEVENAIYPQQPGTITLQRWQEMKDALDKRNDLTANQKAAFLTIYAWEGGLKENKGNGSIAGLTGTALDRTGGDAPTTVNDAINGYVDYFNDTMKTVGGINALNQINDPKAAAAFADTDFYQGRSRGPRLLQQSVNEVLDRLGRPRIDEDGSMGPGLLKAYAELANNPDTRQALLNALYKKRVQWSEEKKVDKKDKSLAKEREADQVRFASFR